MPPAAPAPGSSLTGRPAAAFSSTAHVAQPLFQHPHGVGVGALLRAEHGRGPHRPEQRVFDVGGGDQLDIGQQLAAWLLSRPSSSIMPRPPSVQLLPPSPTTIRPAPASTAAAISCPTPRLCAASAVCTVGGRPAGPARRPARTRCRRSGARPGRVPTARHLLGQRAAHPQGVHLAEPAGQHADEAGPAVGLRGQRQLIVGAAAAPAARDGLGGLDRREAVAVAVGGDQHLHHGRLI